MGLEKIYVCDACGEECCEDEIDESTYILAVRVPPSEDVQQMFACCPECYVQVLHGLIDGVRVVRDEPACEQDAKAN